MLAQHVAQHAVSQANKGCSSFEFTRVKEVQIVGSHWRSVLKVPGYHITTVYLYKVHISKVKEHL